MKGPLTFKGTFSFVNLPLEVDSEFKKGFRTCYYHPPLYALIGCLVGPKAGTTGAHRMALSSFLLYSGPSVLLSLLCFRRSCLYFRSSGGC